MNKYYYIGCFVDREELARHVKSVSTGHLFRKIKNPHVTFAFEPDEVNEKLFGEKIKVEAVGYGNNGVNEGLKVNLYCDNRSIAGMAEEIKVPHITISVDKGGKAYDTRYLNFYDIEPFILEGVFGGYMQNGTVVCSN